LEVVGVYCKNHKNVWVKGIFPNVIFGLYYLKHYSYFDQEKRNFLFHSECSCI